MAGAHYRRLKVQSMAFPEMQSVWAMATRLWLGIWAQLAPRRSLWQISSLFSLSPTHTHLLSLAQMAPSPSKSPTLPLFRNDLSFLWCFRTLFSKTLVGCFIILSSSSSPFGTILRIYSVIKIFYTLQSHLLFYLVKLLFIRVLFLSRLW